MIEYKEKPGIRFFLQGKFDILFTYALKYVIINHWEKCQKS